MAKIESVKGFDKDLKCRGFQFEIGKTYTHNGPVAVCKGGFHACEHPLDVFEYYPPATSRYAAVEQSGKTSRYTEDTKDTKIASASITIVAELQIHDVVAQAIKWVFARAKPENTEHSTGDYGAASSTGYRGAASSTGYRGAASSTGDYGAASSTGDRGAASSTGVRGKVMGAKGNALFLVYRTPWTGEIEHAWAGIVGKGGVKPGVWYTLNAKGTPVEAKD